MIWAEAVERIDGKAVRVEMTNGNVILPFVIRSGKVTALYNEKRPAPGLRTLWDDLFLPPADLKKSFKMAAAILKENKKSPET